MIRPWSIVKDDYVPHFAVDHRFVTSAFVGCILDSRRAHVRDGTWRERQIRLNVRLKRPASSSSGGAVPGTMRDTP